MQEETNQTLSEQEFFDKNYNISYYDKSLPAPSNDLIFMHYISSAVIYSFFTMFVLYNPFYVKLYAKLDWVQPLVICLFLSYLIIAPIILFTFKPKTIYASHSIHVMNYFLRIIKREGFKKEFTATEFLEWLKPTYLQQQSFLLYFVKLYFGPQFVIYSYTHFSHTLIVFKSLIAHYNTIIYSNISGYIFEFVKMNFKLIYYFMLYLLYFIDCFMFTIGYCTELCILKNRIRSIESTFLGLFFCLICYTPINAAVSNILQWYHKENNLFCSHSLWINCLLCSFYLIAIIIYVSASVALFTKGSNLTNRGTVTCFPYNIIRHPAYATKITAWIIASIPVIVTILQNEHAFKNLILYIIGAITFSFVYYMRAITEERHLLKDPDYRAYTKKVKYRFIPNVW